jgi:DNA repair protein RadC
MIEQRNEHRYRIKELPPSAQPRERLRDVGPAALSDAELLAILLRVGVSGTNVLELAQQLLAERGGWPGLLRADYAELCQRHGVGAAKAATLKAALEVGRRLLLSSPDARPQITKPGDAAQLLLLEMSHLEQEHLRVLCLDTKNRVQKIQTVYVGSVNSSQVRVGELFREPVRLNSTAIIVCHNHPSGDPSPSPDDLLVTRAIAEAGKLLDIELLDHLVIGRGHWISMRERGLGFGS